MQKKLTITIDEQVCEGLYKIIGPRHISRFIEDLVRPYVIQPTLEGAYQEMARDEEREAEALAWAEATLGACPTMCAKGLSPGNASLRPAQEAGETPALPGK